MKLSYGKNFIFFRFCSILEHSGATSRGEVIFWGESLVQELMSPWELILNEPVPEAVEFGPSDGPEKCIYFFLSLRPS